MPMKSYDDGTIVQIDHAAGDEVALGPAGDGAGQEG